MTAEEIRDKVPSNDGAFNFTFWLREIALQLAEMNERATKPELEKLRQELREEIAKWRPQGEKAI